jgi:hypothetical protein
MLKVAATHNKRSWTTFAVALSESEISPVDEVVIKELELP